MKKIIFAFLIIFTTFPAFAAGDIPQLITNTDGAWKIKEVKAAPLNGDVYDLSFVAYDKVFAEEFGLDPANVTEMDKGARWMEIQMVTEGQRTNCYYKIILDKSVDIDFPAENYELATRNPPLTLTMDKGNNGMDKIKNRMALIGRRSQDENQQYMNRTYLGNRHYKFNPEPQKMPFSEGSIFDVTLFNYIQNRDIPFMILVTSRECGGGNIYNYPEPSFWVRKKGTKENTTLPQLENYYVFEIPKAIVSKFTPSLFKFENNRRAKLSENK